MKRLIVGIAMLLPLAVEQSEASIIFGNGYGYIQSVDSDGTGLRTIVGPSTSGMYGARGLAVDPIGGQVYFGGEGGPNTYRIARANLDGTGFQPLVDGRPVMDMEVDGAGGKFYIAFGGEQFFRANLDGSGFETISFSFSHVGNIDVRGLALDTSAGKLYFAEQVSGSIYRSNFDGSEAEQVFQFGTGTVLNEIEIDPVAGMLYWSNANQNKLQRGTIDGAFVEDVVVGTPGGSDFNRGLALDVSSQTVYWSTPSSPFGLNNAGGIFRVGFDGTGVSQVLVSSADIQGIDIGPYADVPSNAVPEPASVAVWSLLCLFGIAIVRRRRHA